jgi:hypothetical protein
MKQTQLILEEEGRITTDVYDGNSYEVDVSMFQTVLIRLMEIGGTNSINRSIDTSVKGLRWKNYKTNSNVTANASSDDVLTESINGPLERIRIQVKSTTPGSAGKFNLYVIGMPA